MKLKNFKTLLKEDTPKHIIFLHTISRIYLTNNQLQKVIDLKKLKGVE